MSLLASALAAAASEPASSSVIISNLAYVVGALVLASVIITILAIRHRRPRSTEEDMDDFHRGLAALNPDRAEAQRPGPPGSRPAATRFDASSARPQLRPQRGPEPQRGPAPLGHAAPQGQAARRGHPGRPGGLPVGADGSTPRRPSTRSKSG